MNKRYILLSIISFFSLLAILTKIKKTKVKNKFTHNSNVINANSIRPNLELSNKIDVTIIGSIKEADGLGRIAIGLIDNLSHDLNINFISTRSKIDLTDISDSVKQLAKTPINSIGKVSILLDPLWYPNFEPVKLLPNSLIKIAYSMLESDRIPKKWVNLLNSKFDLVVVPSKFLIKVYKNSGVKIPIFEIPNGVYLESFLKQPLKSKINKTFRFGTSAGFWPHKNHFLLLKAFHKVFKNNPKVKLYLHGRFGQPSLIRKLKNYIIKNNIDNVELILKSFSKEDYLNFMKALDCYILISKGEGFSITPRESLALAVPTVISNNTAHDIICQKKYALCIPAPIKTPADYRAHLGMFSGYNFDLYQQDVEDALKEVYLNYPKYFKKAILGRKWVKNYLFSNVKDYFLTLFKPKAVVFGKKNIVTKDYLMTNSSKLYKKYLQLIEIHNFKKS